MNMITTLESKTCPTCAEEAVKATSTGGWECYHCHTIYNPNYSPKEKPGYKHPSYKDNALIENGSIDFSSEKWTVGYLLKELSQDSGA